VARGAADNPANRFERIHLEETEEALPGLDEFGEEERAPPLQTRFYRDPSRTLLSTNDSPDIPFDTSLNPYRGCEHGCTYCLVPETLVLHADLGWRPLGEVRVGDRLVGFDEMPEPGRTRKLRPATVEHVWASRKPTLRMITRNTEVMTTAEHRWLQTRSFPWSRTEQLTPGRQLRYLPVEPDEPQDDEYRIGYVSGMTLGGGTFRYQPGWRSNKRGLPAAHWRVALIDREPLERLRKYLAGFGIDVGIRSFDGGPDSPRPLEKVETRALEELSILHDLLQKHLPTRSFRRGFLAGFFDAEGHDGTSPRSSQKDARVLERIQRYAASVGFEMKLESRDAQASTLRLIGSIAEQIRFFGVMRPAITRKADRIFGHQLSAAPEPIEDIEPGPMRDVIDIQTSTGTFFADGLATHNCYARPTHEYLGFSAGLDFETRVLVKSDAPELLRKKLASKSWKPQVVVLSGVTDAYQPAERKLRLTRRCLEVFAEFRNPVGIVTKSALVTRDIDILGEMAQWNGASVNVSLTTLNDDLRRALEPRTASPRHRLETITKLAAAGIPVGAMIAPIIPGLNDAEIPSLVAAAADAGARSASPIVLRLPHGLAPLFEAWLDRHAPGRKQKVMNRVRAMRGGRHYDATYHTRMRGSGFFAEQIHALFQLACRRAGLSGERISLSTEHFRTPGDAQLSLL
jgi:DNA repair photolyase